MLDAQSSRADLRGLVALIHGLAYHEAMVADPSDPPTEVVDEASSHAIRDGLDARLALGGVFQHIQGLARQAVDLACLHYGRLAAGRTMTQSNSSTRPVSASRLTGNRAVISNPAASYVSSACAIGGIPA